MSPAEADRALCFSDQPAVITIHVVPRNTPTTRIARYRAGDPRSTRVCR